MGIDQISIEDAHFRNDLRLLEKFPDKKLSLVQSMLPKVVLKQLMKLEKEFPKF